MKPEKVIIHKDKNDIHKLSYINKEELVNDDTWDIPQINF